jgi:hypothetical protein
VAVADPAAAPSTDPSGRDGLERTLFPERVAGLDVQGVRWTLEARSRGLVRGELLAIAGYLAMDAQPEDCYSPVTGIVLPFCVRTGVLGDEPWMGGGLSDPPRPPFHLHPQLPSAVRVPYLAASAARLGIPAQPVIVLARFDDARAMPCIPEGRHCGQELVVERVAWMDGEVFPPSIATVDPWLAGGPLVDPVIENQRDQAVARLGPDSYPLLAALVRRGTLEDMHPVAAAAVADADFTAGLWYVRGLEVAGRPDRIDWLIVDGFTEQTLASGQIIIGAPGGPGPSGQP